ncbi:phosphonate C-P lyase system protein PhnH [Frankia sp. CNm7]|uniref:Phosphonate C-P lyase system protein PhnH n=1 Tax=Frankia nepalensis TaxID=1836974 RepID=A0A937US20_9ACTN|nr:phosphonate C-P lyase system protein PhnH [Frankia nepalensis]MBL7497807.1 phosphonate C-P lyase system protein PhnH [Frankia nepalensis]MBL7512663.1 phosphonate C-P lyase system protein PhnH [Frankia nepalensis]MBL7523188.1 phosphonate C-P lyase system protein PhnH [Frankia nepalensis]MBL7631708.1 phosphonate C-P lyase system protein PhnH [Frankia nepalensis]
MSRTEIALHDAFRATLTALSRPGLALAVPGAADAAAAARLVVDAVWEPDAPPVVITGAPGPGALAALPVGTEEEPELGATVLVVVGAGTATTRARLAGPGVDGELVTDLPLAAGTLAERAAACADWPRGIDLLLVGPGPRIVGLPRTTRVSVLAAG